ncbi:MAG TPA: hypothetical protein VNR67_09510, partial [Solirubrobacterales bacterium]|nr:hypothetical protein [Solirubrobacterales bacterium]
MEREELFAFALLFFAAFLAFAFGFAAFSALPPLPLTAAMLSSRAAIRSGALVAFGASVYGATISFPSAFRSISASSCS